MSSVLAVEMTISFTPSVPEMFVTVTGSVWPGPMITCLIFILMMLTNNVCYIPLK